MMKKRKLQKALSILLACMMLVLPAFSLSEGVDDGVSSVGETSSSTATSTDDDMTTDNNTTTNADTTTDNNTTTGAGTTTDDNTTTGAGTTTDDNTTTGADTTTDNNTTTDDNTTTNANTTTDAVMSTDDDIPAESNTPAIDETETGGDFTSFQASDAAPADLSLTEPEPEAEEKEEEEEETQQMEPPLVEQGIAIVPTSLLQGSAPTVSTLGAFSPQGIGIQAVNPLQDAVKNAIEDVKNSLGSNDLSNQNITAVLDHTIFYDDGNVDLAVIMQALNVSSLSGATINIRTIVGNANIMNGVSIDASGVAGDAVTVTLADLDILAPGTAAVTGINLSKLSLTDVGASGAEVMVDVLDVAEVELTNESMSKRYVVSGMSSSGALDMSIVHTNGNPLSDTGVRVAELTGVKNLDIMSNRDVSLGGRVEVGAKLSVNSQTGIDVEQGANLKAWGDLALTVSGSGIDTTRSIRVDGSSRIQSSAGTVSLLAQGSIEQTGTGVSEIIAGDAARFTAQNGGVTLGNVEAGYNGVVATAGNGGSIFAQGNISAGYIQMSATGSSAGQDITLADGTTLTATDGGVMLKADGDILGTATIATSTLDMPVQLDAKGSIGTAGGYLGVDTNLLYINAGGSAYLQNRNMYSTPHSNQPEYTVISLSNVGDDFVMDDVAGAAHIVVSDLSVGGAINIQSGSNLILDQIGNIMAGGDMTLFSSNGDILATTGTTGIIGGNATLTAAGTIGTRTENLNLTVGGLLNLTANSAFLTTDENLTLDTVHTDGIFSLVGGKAITASGNAGNVRDQREYRGNGNGIITSGRLYLRANILKGINIYVPLEAVDIGTHTYATLRTQKGGEEIVNLYPDPAPVDSPDPKPDTNREPYSDDLPTSTTGTRRLYNLPDIDTPLGAPVRFEALTFELISPVEKFLTTMSGRYMHPEAAPVLDDLVIEGLPYQSLLTWLREGPLFLDGFDMTLGGTEAEPFFRGLLSLVIGVGKDYAGRSLNILTYGDGSRLALAACPVEAEAIAFDTASLGGHMILHDWDALGIDDTWPLTGNIPGGYIDHTLMYNTGLTETDTGMLSLLYRLTASSEAVLAMMDANTGTTLTGEAMEDAINPVLLVEAVDTATLTLPEGTEALCALTLSIVDDGGVLDIMPGNVLTFALRHEVTDATRLWVMGEDGALEEVEFSTNAEGRLMLTVDVLGTYVITEG